MNDAYAAVHPNLVRHDPRYPTAGHLRSRLYVGNIKREGEMEEVTPGSQRIVEVLLNDDTPLTTIYRTRAIGARLTLILYDDNYLVRVEAAPLRDVAPQITATYVPRN
jgi:hypothetical protein